MEQGKEIDKDLNMLQPDPEPDYVDLFASSKPNPVNGGSIELDDNYTDQELVASTQSVNQERAYDPDLDASRGLNESQNDARAREQGTFTKAAKAVGSGIFQGALIAMEQGGYIADMDTYLNLFREVEDLSGNGWTRTMKEWQESARESNTFKIYEEDADPSSIMSSIFKWSSVDAGLSSAIGFGVTGLVTGGAMTWLSGTRKFGQVGKMIDAALKLPQGYAGAKIAQGSSAVVSNFYMGQMMATDTFNQSMEALKAGGAIGPGEGKLTLDEAKKLSANNAQEVVGLNMALSFVSARYFKDIFNKGKKLGAKIKDPAFLAEMKRMVVNGSPTAMVENVYQEMIQMEQIYDTSSEAGLATDYSSDYWDRVSQLALSERAVHAGALGVAGGPIQFAMIQKPFLHKYYSQQKENYAKQEAAGAWEQNLLKNRVDTYKNFKEAENRAILTGDIDAASLAGEMGMIESIAHHGEWGRLDFLKNDTEAVLNMSLEDAAKEGLSDGVDEDYKDTASRILETIKEAEDIRASNVGLETVNEVIYSQLTLTKVKANKAEIKVKKAMALAEIKSDIDGTSSKFLNSLTGDQIYVDTENGDKVKIKRDEGRFEGLTSQDSMALKLKEKGQNNAFNEFLAVNTSSKKYNKFIASDQKRQGLIDKLDAKIGYLTSKEGRAAYIQKQNTSIKKQQKDSKEADSKATQDIGTDAVTQAKKKGNKSVTLNNLDKRIINDKSKKVLDDNLESFNSGERSMHSVDKNNSFSIRDKNGKNRVFTKGDLLMTTAGNYLQVTSTGKKWGELTANVVDSFGHQIGKEYVYINVRQNAADLSFIKPEVKRGTPRKTKNGYTTYTYPVSSNWGEYVTIDSELTPHNFGRIQSMKERAEAGESITLNGNEHEGNWATEVLVSAPFAEKYNHKLANSILYKSESQDVTVRLRDEGEGNQYLDVYLGSERIDRLDRTNNLNYGAILSAVNKSANNSIDAKIVDKFTSIRNFVKLYDSDGLPITHTLTELKENSNSKNHLPNGEVILVKHPGENTAADLAPLTFRENGEVNYDSYINITKENGEIETLEIPFASLERKSGGTFVLIVDPSGKLFPAELGNDQIGTLPSELGNETLVDDIIEQMNDVKLELYGDAISDEVSFDEGVMKEYRDSENYVLEDERKYLQSEKIRLMIEKNPVQGQLFKDKIYKYFRANTEKFLYNTNSENNKQHSVKENKDTGKFEKEYNPRYFKVDTGVEYNTGRFSMYIEQYNSNNPTQKNPNANEFERIYQVADPEAFKEAIAYKFRKTSIREMIAISELGSTAERATAAKQMMYNQGLKFDGNPDQLFTGVSSTLKYEDSDIVDAGVVAANKIEVKIDKKTKLEEVIDEANTEEVVSRIKEILQHDDEASGVNIADFKNDSLEDLTKIGSEIIRNTNARTYREEIKSFEKFMALEHSEEAMTEHDYQDISEEIKNNTQISLPVSVDLAKFTFAITKFRKAVESGDVIVISKSLESKANPEGVIFANGSSVYNTIHGTVRISQYNKKKKAYKATKNGTPVTIFPAQTFTPDSKQAELHKQELRLKTKGYAKGSNAYIAAEEKINRLKLVILGKNSITQSNLEVAGLSIADVDPAELTDKSLESAFTFMTAFSNFTQNANDVEPVFADLDKDASALGKIYKNFSTNRGKEFIGGITKLSGLKTSTIKLATPDKGAVYPLHTGDVDIMIDAIRDGIPYDIKHVAELLALSDSFKGDITNPDIINTLKEVLEFYDGTVKPDTKKIKYSFVNKDGTIVQKDLVLVGEKTTKGKPIKPTNLLSGLSGLGDFLKSVFELESELMDLHGLAKSDLDVKAAKKKNEDTTTSVDEDAVVPMAKTSSTKDSSPVSEAGKVVSKTELAEPGEDASKLEKMLYADFEDMTQEDYNFLTKFTSQSMLDVINESAAMAGGESSVLIDLVNDSLNEMEKSQEDKMNAVADEIKAEAEGSEFLSETEKSSSTLDDALEQWKKNNNNRAKKGEIKVDRTDADFKSEVSRAQLMLPQVDIKVIENVVEMHRKFGTRAIGMYSDGVAYLVNNAEAGTAYHEVFHAVADLYLSEADKLSIAKEYGETVWSEKVDELAAADFEKFVADTSTTFGSIKRKAVKFFQDMMNWIKGIRNSNVTEKIFRSVSDGRYAQILMTNDVENAILSPNKITMETFNNSLLEKDKLTLQELMKSGQIKILC
jgi:hypothetical protein